MQRKAPPRDSGKGPKALCVFGDAYAMPVVIKDVSEAGAEAMALIENHHRAAMSAAKEARVA